MELADIKQTTLCMGLDSVTASRHRWTCSIL